jgi:uncharacterized membrane protein YqaE (UPF0057 family)
MSLWRVLACLLFPPLAVVDKGCGNIVLVTLFTLAGLWVGGIICALIICVQPTE